MKIIETNTDQKNSPSCHVGVDHDYNAPWSLRFERGGTEDFAVLCDADGDELARSRPFWLPNAGEPEPPTLAAMRLIQAAPALLEALRLAQEALNAAPRFHVGETDSYRIAAKVDRAVAMATNPETDESEEA